MKLKKKLQIIGIGACILILILDSNTAIEGARTGIDLCIGTIIPSLFPFVILSNYLLHSISGNQGKISRIMYKYFNIPEAAFPILIAGFLGGYPTGAQLLCSCQKSGKIKKEDAEYLLHFCSNAGPSFLFGIVSQSFPGQHYIWILWIIHILSALLVSLIFFRKTINIASISPAQKVSLPTILNRAIQVMAQVCGWVVLFRVLISFLNKWFLWILSPDLSVLLCGMLELSNGCMLLFEITDIKVRFVICSTLLSFGGLCVTMQTASLVGELSLRSYLCGKLVQTLFSTLVSIGIVYRIYEIVALLLFVSMFVLYKIQKNYRFCAALRV